MGIVNIITKKKLLMDTKVLSLVLWGVGLVEIV